MVRRFKVSLYRTDTGLTLSAQLKTDAGVNYGTLITTGFLEVGGGEYQWTYDLPDEFPGGPAVFYSASGTKYETFISVSPNRELAELIRDELDANSEKLANLDAPVSEVGDASAAAVWSNPQRTLTQSAAQVAAAVEGASLTIHRGDKLTASLTGVGSLEGRTKLWFTVKAKRSQTDAEALIQIIEDTGLVRLNGAIATAAQGSVTVTDEETGAMTIVLNEAATAQLRANEDLVYDIQILTTDGVLTRAEGTAQVTADVTRATS